MSSRLYNTTKERNSKEKTWLEDESETLDEVNSEVPFEEIMKNYKFSRSSINSVQKSPSSL